VIANIAVGEFGTEILHVLISKGLAEALAGVELESEEAPPEAAMDDIDALIASAAGRDTINVSLSELMTDPASRANENALVSSAIAQMEKEGVRQIGVVRDGVLIRVISWGDLRQLMGPFYGTRAMSARDKAVLRIQLGKINRNQKLISVPITGSPSQALELIIEGDLKSLPVVDKSGALHGFIPVLELLKLLRTRLH
ncbi:MAG: CBS domain-containing protein, partial [Gammaproteobacteria bacterium]|nr:CBS domain-containing protein [Gammaproteobacteria bacterium]